ncbi:MAG TPA: hypothetical protein PLL06_00150 [Acidobacteriota bacterium]|nr:hypothetical protein [Acidobacteriota bacterium]HMZ78076.1 hypothetical protein [Acidobacteriota bacterium]HNB70030.1 hypothetical protein [Acidobacteriota bacterium]HND18045.1 hypothetical protein [Acidobacteriota bacterium]HNG92469.1 hypothetical protein [Acidobacteriota bacterium]
MRTQLPFLRKVKLFILLCFLATGWTFVVSAYSGGPDPGYTSAPGDLGTCVSCHDSFELNSGSGVVTLSGVPQMYQPGQTYPLTLTVQQAGRQRWGFQLTTVASTGESVGAFVVTDPINTQLRSTTFGQLTRTYIEHTQAGTFAGTPRMGRWTFSWTAPAEDRGSVSFYFAGNAANNDTTNQQDFIYSGAEIANSPSTQLAVRLLTPNGGESFEAGQPIEMKWETTNASQAESHEVRLSTDGGQTFPSRIAAALSPEAQVFRWTSTPTLNTSMARVRIEAYPKGGLPPVTVASAANFSIVTSNTAAITSLSPTSGQRGTKVILTLLGRGFVSGAQVSLGEGIKIKKVELLSPTELRVTVKVKATALAGTRPVEVTLPDGSKIVKESAFTVQ